MKTRNYITDKTINRITTLVVESSSWDKPLPTSKPRNFVAKNATKSGASAHKDKKRDSKNGNTKHKNKKVVSESLSIVLETLTPDDLTSLQNFAKKLFRSAGVDVVFSDHFEVRSNHDRNIKEITASELQRLFKAMLEKYRHTFSDVSGRQAVVKDMATDINMPTVFVDMSGTTIRDPKSKQKELTVRMIPKTIMRNSDYKTGDPFMYVDSGDKSKDKFKSNDNTN